MQAFFAYYHLHRHLVISLSRYPVARHLVESKKYHSFITLRKCDKNGGMIRTIAILFIFLCGLPTDTQGQAKAKLHKRKSKFFSSTNTSSELCSVFLPTVHCPLLTVNCFYYGDQAGLKQSPGRPANFRLLAPEASITKISLFPPRVAL